MKKLPTIVLADLDAEQVRRSHHEAIEALQRIPAASAKTLSNVSLANGASTFVPHGLGRTPTMVKPSMPRGASSSGYIVEIRDNSYDRTKQLKLQANGYGATITVDIEVQ